MKQTLFITIVWFLLTALPLQAQWNIGGLLTIGSSTVNVDPNPSSENYSGRFGYGLGVVLDRQLYEQFELHTEPMFLQKGTTIEIDGDEVQLKFSYFELPVMVRYNFQPTGNVIPFTMAGPSLGYLTGAKFEYQGTEENAKDEFKSFDFGIGFGGGVKLQKDNLELFAEARYGFGLANIHDNESKGTTIKNRGLHIVFGVSVPFNRMRSSSL